MNEKLTLRVLAEQKEELEGYRYGKIIPRKEERLFEWDSDMAQVVTGVRRSGKSTLCHTALHSMGVKYGYANLDDDRFIGLESSDLNTLLGCIYQIYGTDIQYLFLDEIQNVDGWHLFVNRVLRQGMHIVLTGSNAKLLSGELATHLTGRYNEIRLYPFSFSEYCKAKGYTKGVTTKSEAQGKSLLNSYLMEGGFPELIKIASPRNRRTYIESLIETIISKDIAQRFKIRNVESIRRIAHHLLNNNCQVIDYAALAELGSLKTSMTAQKYTAYLSQAYLIHRLQKFSFKSRERLSGTKSYAIDTGFISNRENSLLGENVGWRLENAVLVELMRRYSSEAEDIYYYKPSTRQKEVDFVVCRQGVVLELVQVAYTVSDSKTFKREISSITDAAEKLNCANLSLICLDETRDVDYAGRKVRIVNAVEWLLQE